MSVRLLINVSWCALLSFAVSGCYSQHQYPYGGAYPGPYGSPGTFQSPPGSVMPGSIPPGNYPVQPDLGQPVSPPQGAIPSSGSQTYNGAFPSNTGSTSYDGVDSQWKQPQNSTQGTGNSTQSPFQANPTASGNNATPGSGLNSNQSVPNYNDPNFSSPQNPDAFQSNQKKPVEPTSPATQMNDSFGSSSDDPFSGNTNTQLKPDNDSGFSVPQPVQQQSFEENSNDSFEGNTPEFKANPTNNSLSRPGDGFSTQPGDSFDANPTGGSPGFEPSINRFPENSNDSDATFGPNNSSLMNPSSGKISRANHQTNASGPQLVKSDQFMSPSKIQTASFELPMKNSDLQTSAAKSPSPFNHDKQQYRWLRGVIEYDDLEKSWNITYNATPDKSDKFGGNIVLVDQGQLSRFKNGDVVLIDGRIDGSRQDKMGKPFYLVERAQRLIPKK